MLWQANLRPGKKLGLMILFGGGLFVVACATLRCILIVAVWRPFLACSFRLLETNI